VKRREESNLCVEVSVKIVSSNSLSTGLVAIFFGIHVEDFIVYNN
jgi:hypothetical protein